MGARSVLLKILPEDRPLTADEQYCSRCGCSRAILADSLRSRGMKREAARERRDSAIQIINACPECAAFFEGQKCVDKFGLMNTLTEGEI